MYCIVLASLSVSWIIFSKLVIFISGLLAKLTRVFGGGGCWFAALGVAGEALIHGFQKDISHCEQELHAGAQVKILNYGVEGGAIPALAIVYLHHDVLLSTLSHCHHPDSHKGTHMNTYT